mmetsp:Transcript_18956/g.52877  ORF Transcript_18956/g.52877 Transcript_18956/m.52877 type:complete len:223 (+) Transcript_18956:2469-3137(+)
MGYVPKYVPHTQHHQPRVVLCADHGICLPATSGTISKYRGVQTTQEPADHSLYHVLVYLLVGGARFKGTVKHVLLLPVLNTLSRGCLDRLLPNGILWVALLAAIGFLRVQNHHHFLIHYPGQGHCTLLPISPGYRTHSHRHRQGGLRGAFLLQHRRETEGRIHFSRGFIPRCCTFFHGASSNSTGRCASAPEIYCLPPARSSGRYCVEPYLRVGLLLHGPAR